MMNDITRLDIEVSIAKLNSLLAVLGDIRDGDAIWKDTEMIRRIDRLWKSIEELQLELDNSY